MEYRRISLSTAWYGLSSVDVIKTLDTSPLGLEQAVTEADCVLNKGPREVPELISAVTRLLRKSMKKPAAVIGG